MAGNERGLISWLRIFAKLTPTIRKFRALPKTDKPDLGAILPLAQEALELLVAQGVSLEEIAALIKERESLIELAGALL